jgi:hypothetical protein
MCSPLTMQGIVTVIEEMIKQRLCFTGEDVFKRMHNKHIKRQDDFSVCTESPQEISKEVRQLFNSQNPVFQGYGSTIVPHGKGPVLYFALPYHAKRYASKIVNLLNDQP